jgi:hypothetical protein
MGMCPPRQSGCAMSQKRGSGRRRLKPPQRFWALFTADGRLFGCHYASKQEAHDDAVGPAFRPTYTVREYGLVKRKDEVSP